MKYLRMINDNALSVLLMHEYEENLIILYSDVARAYAHRLYRADVDEEVLNQIFTSGKFNKEISEIVNRASVKTDSVIGQIYREGGNSAYTSLKVSSRFGQSFKEGFQFLQQYNHVLLNETVADFRGAIMKEVAEGFATGEHPFETARHILSSGVDLPAKAQFTTRQRAFMIARTESARAWAQGSAQAYANVGVTHYDHVCYDGACEDCLEYEAENPHLLTDLSIPVHPNCRCGVAPVIPDTIQYRDDVNVINLTPIVSSYEII